MSGRLQSCVRSEGGNHLMKELSVIIGSAGVGLLLVAFLLNLFKIILQESRSYAVMNIIGAGLSCYASVLIDYIPFVVLEATWCLVAFAGLVRSMRRRTIFTDNND